MKKMIGLVGIFCAATLLSADEIVFKDDFSCYCDTPPQAVFTDACTIGELPPALRRLQIRPKDGKKASVYNGAMFKLPNKAQVPDYQFSFKFEFPRDSKKAFDLDLYANGDGDKIKQAKYTFSVTENGLNFRSGIPASKLMVQTASFKDLDLPGFAPSGWNELKIIARGRNMEVFANIAGRFVRFGILETLGTPITGFNFSAGTSVDLDDIELISLPSCGNGTFITDGNVNTANGSASYEIDTPPGTGNVKAEVRVGWLKGGLNIKLVDESGKEKVITGKVMPISFTRMVTQNIYEQDDKTGKYAEKPVQKQIPETYTLPDTYIRFTGLNAGGKDTIDYFFRPQIGKMDPSAQVSYAREWTGIPGASERFIKYEFRLSGTKNFEVWIDGRYVGVMELESNLKKISFELPGGASAKNIAVIKKADDSLFLPLDISSSNGNPGIFADAEPVTGGFFTSRKCAGERILAGVPFIVMDGPENVDVGNIRNVWGDEWGGERYWSRNPYNGAKENIIFPVPNRQYSRAWVLCAIEDDPFKEPVLTVRLTRYGGLVGPQIADTTLRLPRAGEPMPAGVTKVGGIKVNEKNLPLYLAEVKIDSGRIQDLIFQSVQPGVLNDSNMSRLPRLDFELMGDKEQGNHFYVNRETLPSYSVKSAVHVFGATLEKSPVEFCVLPAVFGNSYLPGERTEMDASVRAVEKGAYNLEWTIKDIDGKETGHGKKELKFSKAGEEVKFPVNLLQKDLGWYSVYFKLSDTAGVKLLDHTANFCLVAADKRKAGYDSQYFAWSHNRGVHGDVHKPELLRELYGRAGIGTITPIFSEADFSPNKITVAAIPWENRILHSKLKQAAGNKADWKFPGYESEEYINAFKKCVDDFTARFPHVKSALIFHEGKGGRYPVEIFREQLTPDENADNAEKRNYDEALGVAKLYRKYYPQLKLEVGNCGDSSGVMASLFRNKFPAEYIDYIGEEWGGGLTKLAEDGLSRNFWSLREISRKFGYDKPLIANYEWKYRKVNHEGLRQNAIWSARDWLVAHAWRSPRIPFTSITDAGNYYYNTVWGDGLLSRYPETYPYPAYTAAATMTQVLDCAKLEKQLNTGSTTVYGLEFKRGNEYVYAFWTARGQLSATLSLDKDLQLVHTSLFGTECKVKSSGGKLLVTISEEPFYLTSTASLKVTELGKRIFPSESVPAENTVSIASIMDKVADWNLKMGKDEMLEEPVSVAPKNLRFRRPGKFELRQVKDDEKGECLELELLKSEKQHLLIQEYCSIKLKTPVLVPGEPDTVGVWVKGNSGWGKLFFEFEDAEGEKWTSGPTGGFGCDVYDLTDLASINFDGWHFVRLPINSKSHLKPPSVLPETLDWRHDGTGNRKVDFPIKLKGIGVATGNQAINLVNEVDVNPVLKFKDFSAY
jgi:hypothetical protein